jgi:hypothetical protein
MDNNRHKADSGRKYSLYFYFLREKIEHCCIEPHHTYNMDEKGCWLLIPDGHGSHLTTDSIKHCNQNRILLAVYPPHSIQTLQPPLIVMFKPLATGYSNKVTGFMERSHGFTSMSKKDFFPLFYQAWQASFNEMTVLKASEATGLSSFNPEVIVRLCARSARESLHVSNRVIGRARNRIGDRVQVLFYSQWSTSLITRTFLVVLAWWNRAES